MGLIEQFDDRERLDQRGAAAVLQRRNQALGVEREITGRALFALAEVMRQMLCLEPLEVQRDPDAIGRAAAEITVQLDHGTPPGTTVLVAIDGNGIGSIPSINNETCNNET